jgi:hypothetical protein
VSGVSAPVEAGRVAGEERRGFMAGVLAAFSSVA